MMNTFKALVALTMASVVVVVAVAEPVPQFDCALGANVACEIPELPAPDCCGPGLTCIAPDPLFPGIGVSTVIDTFLLLLLRKLTSCYWGCSNAPKFTERSNYQ